MDKPIIFLDFDDTLFQTKHRWTENDRGFVSRLGIPMATVIAAAEDLHARGIFYTMENHLRSVSTMTNIDIPIERTLAAFQNKCKDLAPYLFPDVISWLQGAKEHGIPLYVLSHGDPAWQDFKLEHSHIIDYFIDRIYTKKSAEKINTVLQLFPNATDIIFVDDNSKELNATHVDAPNLKIIRMNRYCEPKQFVYPEISTLNELNLYL